MSNSTVLVTTSIPYVNGAPHVGFAWELVLADVLARYHRLRGARVRFLTGTDDNSLKNVQAAERAGLPTHVFVRQQGDRFVALAAALGLSNDDFLRTAFDPRHAPAVERLWLACAETGDVYARPYQGAYCVGCEQFYSAAELPSGRCPEHDQELERIEESNYFFRLSRYQSSVADALSSGALRIWPAAYQPETRGWLESGLLDFSISRSQARARGWGIRVPGDDSQTVYVWFDALANYLSALGYATQSQGFTEFWCESQRRIHVIGKNVTRFHCVYWPGILQSAGLSPPSDVVVHGFLTVDGRKIGKSLGNGIDPFELVDRFGRERLRYYLLRHFPLGRDGDFSVPALTHASNAELCDQLGNLLQRSVVLIEKGLAGVLPAGATEHTPLAKHAERAATSAGEELERCAPDRALSAVFELVEAANLYVSRTEPWRTLRALNEAAPGAERKRLRAELELLLGEVGRALLWIGGLLQPFLPDSAQQIGTALGTALPNPYQQSAGSIWSQLGAGARVTRTEVLCARLPLDAD